MIKKLSVDIETYSDVDLIKCGVYKYADSPNFEILLFAYSVDDGEIHIIDLVSGGKLPPEITEAIKSDTVIKTAFNAQFERCCLSKYLELPKGKYLNPQSWYCTAVQAAELSLPASLADVGAALGLERQKLTEGKDLIKYFCVPCKPTKANGGRTRNMPQDAPDKWERFKEYCKRDVDVERQIAEKLRKYPVSESERRLYILDQNINDRGVSVDLQLSEQAVRMSKTHTAVATEQAYALTGLENPNSVAQLKQWLAENGVEVEELSKKAVKALSEETDGDVREVLRLRLLLSKTSVKKYEAVMRSVCRDNRVRGMLRFYGANRSGRWSGQILQLQNLPQNHLPDLTLARDIVKSGDFELLDMTFGNVPTVLSELIRTALIPKDGCRFIVADFSAIEARVLSWLAGERWRIETFKNGGDIYCASASRMFHVPVEKHGVNGHLRQKGKISELACIAEGSPVLTDKGLVPIENITLSHKLWDGSEWVSHDGVVFRGYKEVITYEGLTATRDHLVWIEGKSEPVRFGFAASCGAHLIQTGYGRAAVRLGENHISGKAMEQNMEPLLCLDRVRRMRLCSMAEFIKSADRKIKGMSELLAAEADPAVAGQEIDRGKAAVRKSAGQGISQLWRKRNQIRLCERNRSGIVSDRKVRITKPGIGDRPYRQQRKLCKREHTIRDAQRKQFQQAMYGIKLFFTKIPAVCAKCCDPETVGGIKQKRNHSGRGNSGIGEKEKLEVNSGAVRVYDIRNAGRRHCFTVSGKLVHNCGYGGSVGALKSMGAVEMGVPEDELTGLISQWRQANPNIVRLWGEVGRAAMEAVAEKKTVNLGNLVFIYENGILFIRLPSGRRLSYVKPHIETNRFGSAGITYMGIGASKKWERLETFAGKLVENIVQGIARDLLAAALVNVSDAGYDIVFHVHDEIIAEVPIGIGSVDEMCELMSINPDWAVGLPLSADGYECEYYRKD
ncbi:MAG: hypothetical protein J1F64_03665 [Oscillospiraceae bacterium]|nr:hypothetical protein [Oscillospiraceae bacterium]